VHLVAYDLYNDFLFMYNTIKPIEENNVKSLIMDIYKRSLKLIILFKRTKTNFI
jgi:hypothetical protein